MAKEREREIVIKVFILNQTLASLNVQQKQHERKKSAHRKKEEVMKIVIENMIKVVQKLCLCLNLEWNKILINLRSPDMVATYTK